MKRARVLVAVLVAACRDDVRNESLVEVLRVAPPQLLGDSLEITPRLDTTQNAPERGLVALSIEMQVRNASGSTRPVPRIGFRAIAETVAATRAAPWQYVIGRRTVDSLRAGESASFGVTTSPSTLANGTVVEGVYRVEAVLGDSTTSQRAVPLGRVRLTARLILRD